MWAILEQMRDHATKVCENHIVERYSEAPAHGARGFFRTVR